MRAWPEGWKKTLRHLAAARYYLPVELDQANGPDVEAQYMEYLHHTEFGLALESIEDLGNANRGHAEEPLFWEELLLAAESMKDAEATRRCRDRLRECQRGGPAQGTEKST